MNKKTRHIITKIVIEGVLISSSVFFALLIDNWRKEIEERNAEKLFINGLIDDLRSDSIHFNFVRSTLSIELKNFNTLLNLGKFESYREDSLFKYFYRAINVSRTKLHAYTYEVMRNSSGFSVFQNRSLLLRVVKYYSETVILDDSNNELMRMYQQYVDLLGESGFVQPELTNLKAQYDVVTTKKAKGLLSIRKLYSEWYLEEVVKREELASELIKDLIAYRDK